MPGESLHSMLAALSAQRGIEERVTARELVCGEGQLAGDMFMKGALEGQGSQGPLNRGASQVPEDVQRAPGPC